MSRIILAYFMIALSSCTCSSNTSQPPSSSNNNPSNNNPDNRPRTLTPINWSPTRHVYKAKVWIKKDQLWVKDLGIDLNVKQAVVVNASNKTISYGGGGINGALQGYVAALEKQTAAWENLVLPDGKTPTPIQIKAGEYAISDVSFGKIFHACGPIASEVGSLEEAKNQVSTLYYNMLYKAHQDGMHHIVLPAISTEIFAGGGQGFTKKEFIHTIYEGMIEGIDTWQRKYPRHSLSIILNNWDEKVVEQVSKLRP